MTLVWMMLACSGGPELPTGPDPEATAAAVDNLCKLYESARMKCRRGTGEVTGAGKAITVSAQFDELEERLGVTTFKGTVTLTAPDGTWVTRMSGYGSGRAEALKRGLHEWALVDGSAFVDAVEQTPTQPVLQAVEPGVSLEAIIAKGRPVYRGWTLMRPPLEGGLDHAKLTQAATASVSLDGSPHAIRIDAARNLGDLVTTCYLDGKVHEGICKEVATYPWPELASFEARQTYVFGPMSGL